MDGSSYLSEFKKQRTQSNFSRSSTTSPLHKTASAWLEEPIVPHVLFPHGFGRFYSASPS